MDDHTYSFFEAGFNLCSKQVLEASLIPEDRKNFPDVDKALASLSVFLSENEKPNHKDEEPKHIDPKLSCNISRDLVI